MTTQAPLNQLHFSSTGFDTSDIYSAALGTNYLGNLVGTLTSPFPGSGKPHVVELEDGTRAEFKSGFAAREWLRDYFCAE